MLLRLLLAHLLALADAFALPVWAGQAYGLTEPVWLCGGLVMEGAFAFFLFQRLHASTAGEVLK